MAETKIIQIRTKILTENRILKLKQPREKFFNEIISEALYLESQGFDKQLIKEEFWDTLKGMFGQHGSEAIFGTFKEYMGKWLLQKLTPVNPVMKYAVESNAYAADDFDLTSWCRINAGLRYSSFLHLGPYTLYQKQNGRPVSKIRCRKLPPSFYRLRG